MIFESYAGIHPNLALSAKAGFTKDMAEALAAAFYGKSDDDVITVEFREFGVWIIVDGPTRMFLGSTVPKDSRC